MNVETLIKPTYVFTKPTTVTPNIRIKRESDHDDTRLILSKVHSPYTIFILVGKSSKYDSSRPS